MTKTGATVQDVLDSIPPSVMCFDALTYRIICEIYDFLEAHNISEKVLAEKLKVTERRVKKMLSGDVNPSILDIANILTVISAEMEVKIGEKHFNRET